MHQDIVHFKHDEGDSQTQACFADPKQLAGDLWTRPLEERGLDPALVLWAEKATVSGFFSHSRSHSPSFPPSHSLILSRAKCQKTWHLTALATTLKKRRGKKAVPPSRADWRHLEALGVRHSSSSFLHWRLYKQVSKTPDLVWQTFSKEHLKKG